MLGDVRQLSPEKEYCGGEKQPDHQHGQQRQRTVNHVVDRQPQHRPHVELLGDLQHGARNHGAQQCEAKLNPRIGQE